MKNKKDFEDLVKLIMSMSTGYLMGTINEKTYTVNLGEYSKIFKKYIEDRKNASTL